MITDVGESLKDNFLNKLKSPFYGAFIGSWCAWNWKILYVTFFIDQELLLGKNNILKIEYIDNLYSSFFDHIVFFIFLPFISSYVIVFLMPKITNVFSIRWLEYSVDVRGKKWDIEKKELKIENERLGIQKEREDKERVLSAQWTNEYNDFRKTRQVYSNFKFIYQSVYLFGGKIFNYSQDKVFEIPVEVVAHSDTHGLIEADRGKNSITLTDKGKFFIGKYIEETKNIQNTKVEYRKPTADEIEANNNPFDDF